MKSRLALTVALSLLTAVGCAATTEEETVDATEEELRPGYQSIVRCDGNAIELEVKKSERRDLILNINDTNIVKYLSSKDTDLAEKVGASGKLSLPVSVPNGIFRPSQWNHLEIPLRDSVEGGWIVNELRVFRDFTGVKAQVIRPAAYVCFYPNRSESGGTYIEYPIGQNFCPGIGFFGDPGSFVERRAEREIAQWYFQSCR